VTAERLRRFHGVMVGVWIALVPPSVLLWRNSLPFLVFISVYANIAGHLAGFAGSRAEAAEKE
jgi:hypothetical protein